jgi:hypothetical protein
MNRSSKFTTEKSGSDGGADQELRESAYRGHRRGDFNYYRQSHSDLRLDVKVKRISIDMPTDCEDCDNNISPPYYVVEGEGFSEELNNIKSLGHNARCPSIAVKLVGITEREQTIRTQRWDEYKTFIRARIKETLASCQQIGDPNRDLRHFFYTAYDKDVRPHSALLYFVQNGQSEGDPKKQLSESPRGRWFLRCFVPHSTIFEIAEKKPSNFEIAVHFFGRESCHAWPVPESIHSFNPELAEKLHTNYCQKPIRAKKPQQELPEQLVPGFRWDIIDKNYEYSDFADDILLQEDAFDTQNKYFSGQGDITGLTIVENTPFQKKRQQGITYLKNHFDKNQEQLKHLCDTISNLNEKCHSLQRIVITLTKNLVLFLWVVTIGIISLLIVLFFK